MAGTAEIQLLTEENFTDVIASGITLVDFFAEWCGPCKMLAPVLEELAKTIQGQAIVAKVDIDTCQEIASRFMITSVPTVVLFKDGQEVDRAVGVKDVDALKAMIDAA